jgi:tol-pal system protein YbgF
VRRRHSAGWRLLPSVRRGAWLGLGLTALGGCVTKGDIQRVQDDVALFKAETARRDSARAAQLAELIQVQQRIMDSLTSSRKTVAQLRGDLASDLYNIQQQLVQLQELTGQSQQRLSELRTQLEARGEQIATTGPTDTSRTPSPSAASADQMYEASLAQLRRGSTSTARSGLREMLRLYPTSDRTGDALYFIGQSYAAENTDSAIAYYDQVVQKYPASSRAGSALYNLGLLAERRKETRKARDAYQRVIQKYPRSDEAALARDRLKALGR